MTVEQIAEHQILKNGFKVIYASDHSNPLVSIHLYIRIGSAWERPEEAGYSHFSEHLVFKSTRNYPDGGVMDRISFLGGSINAYTEYDSTCYYIDISSENIEESVKILADLVRYPDFSLVDFKSEKKVIFEELKETENDPEDYLIEKIADLYLRDNTYKNPIIGNRKTLIKASQKDLQEFISHYYFPGNCILVVAGDFERESLNAAIESYFGDWEAKEEIIRNPQFGGHPDGFEFKTINHKSQSDVIAVAIPDLAETHPDAVALSLVDKALFIEKNSYIYDELFKRRQLVDSIKINSISGINDGLSIIMLFPKKGIDPVNVIKAFRDCWYDFRCRGISAVQLMQHKAEVLNSFRFSREYVESYASSLGMDEIYSDYRSYYTYPDELKKISRSDIRVIIDKWLKEKYIKIFYQGTKTIPAEQIKALFEEKPAVKYNHTESDYVQKHLDNGVNVLYRKITGKPTIGISAGFNVSQLYESPDNRGVNYLTGALMLYGNKLHSYDKFMDFCALHGINLRVNPQMDITTLRVKCFTEDLPLALESISYVLFQPELPRDHFQNIKDSILSMMSRIKDYPQQQAMKMWRKLIFGSSSNLFSKEGMRHEFHKLTLSRVRKWHKDYYTPDNMTLVITGDIEFGAVDEIASKYFGEQKEPHVIQTPRYEVYPDSNHVRISDQQSSQGIILIGGFAPGLDDQNEVLPMTILCQILGGDTNSQLFNELREKYGLAYSVEMEYFTWKKMGTFITEACVDRKNTERGVQMIKQIFKDIAEKGVSERELTKIKNHIAGQMLQQEESVASVASAIGYRLALGLGIEHYLTRRERLRVVSREQVQAVAQKYLREENYYIQILK